MDEDPFDLQRVGDDADHVRELLLIGDRGLERPLGERAVGRLSRALRAAHEAGLSHRERREVVVVPEPLGLLQAEVVDLHVQCGWCRAPRWT